jgi:hypothetical protein
MSTSRLTPATRALLGTSAIVYLLASHDVLTGGPLLRAVWVCAGLGLVVLLALAAVAVQLGWPIGATRPMH